MFILYEKLSKIQNRDDLSLYCNALVDKYSKMRKKTVAWVLFNYKQVMCWDKDELLKSVVFSA